MVTDCAASRSADLPMPGHMSGYATDYRTFDTPLGLSRRQRESENSGTNDKSLHLLILQNSQINGRTVQFVPQPAFCRFAACVTVLVRLGKVTAFRDF